MYIRHSQDHFDVVCSAVNWNGTYSLFFSSPCHPPLSLSLAWPWPVSLLRHKAYEGVRLDVLLQFQLRYRCMLRTSAHSTKTCMHVANTKIAVPISVILTLLALQPVCTRSTQEWGLSWAHSRGARRTIILNAPPMTGLSLTCTSLGRSSFGVRRIVGWIPRCAWVYRQVGLPSTFTSSWCSLGQIFIWC